MVLNCPQYSWNFLQNPLIIRRNPGRLGPLLATDTCFYPILTPLGAVQRQASHAAKHGTGQAPYIDSKNFLCLLQRLPPIRARTR